MHGWKYLAIQMTGYRFTKLSARVPTLAPPGPPSPPQKQKTSATTERIAAFVLLAIVSIVFLVVVVFIILDATGTWTVFWGSSSSSLSQSTFVTGGSSIPSFSSSSSSSSSGTTSTGSQGVDTTALDSLVFFHQGASTPEDVYVFSTSVPNVVSAAVYMNTTFVEASWGGPGGKMDIATNLNPDSSAIPIGLTSAVPLGGVGTGNYEIKADGKMYLSTIRNQDMAGEPWQGTVRDFAIVVSVNSVIYSIRIDSSVPLAAPVPTLVYQGLYPLSKLTFLDMSLYMYSTVTPADLPRSNTPAVVFSLHVNNPSTTATLDVSFLMIMPMGIRNDWTQVAPATAFSLGSAITSSAQCASACSQSASCLAWQYNTSTGVCVGDTVYTEGYNSAGFDSGHPGVYNLSTNFVSFQTAATGSYNGLGQQILYSPSNYSITVGTADNWTQAMLAWPEASPEGGHLLAYLSVNAGEIPPLASAQLHIIHAWYYPIHYFSRNIGGQNLGNYYTNQYSNALSVAQSINLTDVSVKLVQWQIPFSTMPTVVQDHIFNAFSHARSAMYFQNGDWRQWESYGFGDYDSVHNDAERRIPYLFYWPETERNKILAWANTQLVDGMIQEQFNLGTAFDQAGSRFNSDVTTTFITLVWEHASQNNDTELVNMLYSSHVVPAFNWITQQAVTSNSSWDLPYALTETYDGPAEGILGSSMYSSVFFFTALKSYLNLATLMHDSAGVSNANAALANFTTNIQNLWITHQSFFIGQTAASNYYVIDASGGLYKSSDELHSQLDAYRLSLGEAVPRQQMKLHQVYINQTLSTPYGYQFNLQSVEGENWIMGDSTASALLLWWNEAGAWSQVELQLSYFRDTMKDLWRPTAVIDTNAGAYIDLVYYGWMMWFYGVIPAYSGQQANLIRGTISFSPYGGAALVPIALPGVLGYLTTTSTTATITILFQQASTLTFLNVTICDNVFLGSYVFQVSQPLHFQLTTPCSTEVSTFVQDYNAATHTECSLTSFATNTNINQGATYSYAYNLTYCSQIATTPSVCAMLWVSQGANTGICQPSSPCCFLIDTFPCSESGALAFSTYGNTTAALVSCPTPDFTSSATCANAAGSPLNGKALGDPSFAPLASNIYSQHASSSSLCNAAAIQYQVCGWEYFSYWTQTAIGTCISSLPCCILNPNRNCANFAPVSNTNATAGFITCT
jgi:uncharacterized protein (DUF608 family)